MKFHKKKNEKGSGLFAKGTLKLVKTKQSGPQAMAGGGEAPGRPNSGEDGSPPARERGGRAKGVCGLPWGGGLEARGGRWRAVHGGQCSPAASSSGVLVGREGDG